MTGDEWKICMTTRVGATGSDRPRKFATKADTGVVLEVLKRGKPRAAAKPFKETTSKRADAPTGGATELEGEWSLVSGSLDGKPMDAMTVSYGVRSFQGNHTTLKFGPQTMIDATFSLDPSKSPHEIDYTHSKGMFAGKQQFGIYECDGQTLKLCASKPGTSRPKDFKPGAGATSQRLRRSKLGIIMLRLMALAVIFVFVLIPIPASGRITVPSRGEESIDLARYIDQHKGVVLARSGRLSALNQSCRHSCRGVNYRRVLDRSDHRVQA